MLARHIILSVFAFLASQANVAKALPSPPLADSSRANLDGQVVKDLGTRTAAIASDTIEYEPSKALLLGRQSGWTDANAALADWAKDNLPIPTTVIGLTVVGNRLFFKYTTEVRTLPDQNKSTND